MKHHFVPNPGVFFGDYTNITVHNNVVRPIWTRLHNGQLSLWTDITPFEVLQTEDFKPAVVSETLQYPNPASNISYVSFKLHQDSNVSLYLYDQQGRKVFTVLKTSRKVTENSSYPSI